MGRQRSSRRPSAFTCRATTIRPSPPWTDSTYNILHNTGNLTNFFGWYIYGRIPRQRTVGGDTFDTDWHDYRVYAAETNPPHEYPRTYATWLEIGTDATYRYARINLNHALQNYTYQAQADLDRVTGTEYHGDIPDAGQVKGGVFDPARLGSGTRNASTVLHGDGQFRTAGPAFNTAVATDIDITSGLRFKATGFTGWEDKTVIFVSIGAQTSTSQVHSPGVVLFVADILALDPATTDADRTTAQSYQVDMQDPRDDDDTVTLFFARTASNELLFGSLSAVVDAYPFRAVAL